MIQQKKITLEREVCTCDRCGKDITKEENTAEWQERFVIRFRAGYGSVFGDGNTVEGDICQDCLQAVLGKYLRITLDDPFRPKHQVEGEPDKIYQPNQLALQEQLDAENSAFWGAMSTTLGSIDGGTGKP